MGRYFLNFPRGLHVDVNGAPENFDDMIHENFKAYTEGTRADYRYLDKLRWIDLIRKYNNDLINSEEAVMKIAKNRFAYKLEENGVFMDASDFKTLEMMEECFEAGRVGLYNAHLFDDYHTSKDGMRLIARAIKIVMDYPEEEEA